MDETKKKKVLQVLFTMTLFGSIYFWFFQTPSGFLQNPILGIISFVFRILLPILVILGGIDYFSNQKTAQKKQTLLQIGKRAKAKIIKLEDKGVTINSNKFYAYITVEVGEEGSPLFTSTIEKLVDRLNIPRVGDQLEVIYNPSNTSEIMIVEE